MKEGMKDHWDIIGEQRATSRQRQACYRFLAGVDAAEVKDLIRHLTANEAAAVLDALVKADHRRVAAMAKTQEKAAEGPQQASKREATHVDPELEAILLG